MSSSEAPEKEERKCCDYENCPAYQYCWDDSNNKFPPIRSLFLVSNFFFYILDVGLDCHVAYGHYRAQVEGTDPYAGHYFRATLFFIIFPLVIVNVVSWLLYVWGWVMYRSARVRHYFNERTEDLVYVELGKNERGERRMSQAVPVFNVEDVQVITWPSHQLGAKKRKRKNMRRHRKGSNDHPITLQELPDMSILETEERDQLELEQPLSTDWIKEGNEFGKDEELVERETGFDDPDGEDCNFSSGRDSTDGVEFYPLDLFDTYEFICVTVLHMLMLGYVFRIIRLVYKRKQDTYSFDRYRDVSFLRLIEAFLEAAPQVILQLYVVLVRDETRLLYKVITPISISVSMVSLALAVADYISAGKDLYFYDPPPNRPRRTERLSWSAYFLIIFWHFFMIFSRGIAFALFASIYGRYLFVMVGLHYGLMVYWMYRQNASILVKGYKDYFDPRRHVCGNWGIELVVAAFNTFFHFKLKDGSSMETLVPFYTLAFVENTLMVLLWFFGRDYQVDIWYDYPALLAVFGGFVAGLGFLIGYYVYVHKVPGQQLIWVPDTNLDHPTLTCCLNRMYRLKEIRGNFFERVFCKQKLANRKNSIVSTRELVATMRRESETS